MNEDDKLLADMPITLRGPLDLEALSKTFNYVMVINNPQTQVTNLLSLIDLDNKSKPLVCPRDASTITVLLEGSKLISYSCCDVCLNQIDCYVLGVTKKFILAKYA